MIFKLLPLLGIIAPIVGYVSGQADGFDVKELIPGRVYHSLPRNGNERLSIYCYKGVPKHILHFWQTVNLHVNLEPEDFKIYRGHTSDDVLHEYDNHRNSWSPSFFSWRSKTLSLEPFNSSCVGVLTSSDHTVYIHIIRIDFWRLLAFLGGFALFLAAPHLSSNSFFYYVCGISLGLTASLLLLVYIFSKFIPKKTAIVGYFVSGSIGAYLLRLLWQNMRTVVVVYQSYAIGYVVVMGLISFGICYRIGPVSDPRTIRLIQWSLQGAGLCLMLLSSQFQEASMAVILLILSYYNFPTSWIRLLKMFWHRRFPPQIRLLSEGEYHEQGARETVKALDDLRQYCSSPECNQWRTILTLKKPIRFAQFMEGQSHLSDEEIIEYEADNYKQPNLTSDESDTSSEVA